MIMHMSRPFAYDHPDGPGFCKWSFGWAGLLQMIILMGQAVANDHPDGPAFCKWSFGWARLLQMIICISSFQPDSSPFLFLFSANFLFSSNKHHLLHQNISSSSNKDQSSISRTFLKQCVLVKILFPIIFFRSWADRDLVTSGGEIGFYCFPLPSLSVCKQQQHLLLYL